MNTIRSLLALAFAATLATSAAFAETSGKKSGANAKPEKAACGCVVAADGKVCGVDTACCCKGGKAKGAEKADKAKGKGDAKKACCATAKCDDAACKPGDGKKAKAKKEKKAKGDCAACTACAEPGAKADK